MRYRRRKIAMSIKFNFNSILTDIESPFAAIILNKAFGGQVSTTLSNDASTVVGIINDYATIKAAQSSGQPIDQVKQQVATVAANAVGQLASAFHMNAALQRDPTATPNAGEQTNELLLFAAQQIAGQYAAQTVESKIVAQSSAAAPATKAPDSPAAVDDAGKSGGPSTGENGGTIENQQQQQ